MIALSPFKLISTAASATRGGERFRLARTKITERKFA